MSGFKDLEVWKLAVQLADNVLGITEKFPKHLLFTLGQQMQRAAISIPSNIAEGSARRGTKEFIQFIFIARGSLAELETQITLAHIRRLISDKDFEEMTSLINRIGRMLIRLIESQKR